jgi:hypothetical protein
MAWIRLFSSASGKQCTARRGATRYRLKPSGLEEFFREVWQGVEEMLYRDNSRDFR